MKQRITIIIMLAGLVTMLAGCAENISVRKGEQVRFTISAKGSPETKTAYTDEITKEDGKNYERIDWVAGDKIRIVSGDISKVSAQNEMTDGSTQTLPYYDYTIASAREDGRYSRGTLTKPADGEGLRWVNDPYGVTFYGSYPPVTFTSSSKEFSDMGIGSDQTVRSNNPVVTKPVTEGQNSWTRKLMMPSMDNAYMICDGAEFAETAVEGGTEPTMNMDFYPVFNAFYVELKSEEGGTPIVIDKVSLSSTSDNLAGSFTYSVADGVVQATTGASLKKEVGVDLATTTIAEANRTAKPAEGNNPEQSVVTTLLTLPPTGSKVLGGTSNGKVKNLTLHVTYHLQGQTQTSTANLDLKGDEWLQFSAFQKARILGLRMKGGLWKLDIMTDVNDWTLIEKETSFVNQVGFRSYQDEGGRNVLISGMTETGNHEMPNDVPETDPSYYARYYQIRTLDMSVDNPHFVVKFMPSSPVGGYWMLAPEGIGEGSLQYFDIKYHLGEGVYSDELMGQIMGTEVEIHIFPSEDFDPNAGVSYAMIMKCYFSAQRSFDDPYSADSEFQDVHGDGRYSYWRFTLPSNN